MFELEKLYVEYFMKLTMPNKCNIFLIRGGKGIGKECICQKCYRKKIKKRWR